MNNFPGSVGILDFYPAYEHLAAFCALLKSEPMRKPTYERLRGMLYDGEIVQDIEQMRTALGRVSDRSEAVKELSYLRTNRHRMHYDEYRERGYLVGSGLVEGSCKFVVGTRFKGSGMRWKQPDDEAVLKVRPAVLDGTLQKEVIDICINNAI